MNNRALYISNQRVDLPDSVSFNLKWQCAEPGELKIYGSGSTTIRLPFTPTNDAVFRYSKILTVIGGREFETFKDCRYYERGRLMIFDGTAFLVAIADGYEICLTWGNGDYVQSLKDKSVADLGGDTFAWDNSVPYPQVETSMTPSLYSTFYLDKGTEKFRPAMTRPLFSYLSILNTVGIGQDNMPSNVYSYLCYAMLQANSLQAKGLDISELKYVQKETRNITLSAGGYYASGAIPYDKDKSPCIKIDEITVSQDGEYTIHIIDNYIEYYSVSEYGGSTNRGTVCFFISDTDADISIIGIKQGYHEPFVDRYTGEYMPMYINGSEDSYYPENAASPTNKIEALAICRLSTDSDYQNNVFESVNGGDLVNLKKNVKYCVYAMPNSVGSAGKIFVEFSVMVGLFVIGNTTNVDSNIETPDNPVLKLRPPKAVQMLGYSTAHDIVQDFMRLFPLMVILYKGQPYYFDLSTVLENKPNAYDFSPYFVSLNKIEFGNSKVGLRNEANFADYEDFTGKRANGTFTTIAGRGNGGEYTKLDQITSYDTTTPFNDGEMAYFPQTEVTYDDKTQTYKAKLQERPNLLYYRRNRRGSANSYKIEDGNGAEYTIYKEEASYGTFQHIIDKYWQDFINIVSTQKTVTVTLNIDPGELFDFDFRRPVYLKQISVYVFAQKITYKGAGVAELVGIVLPSTSQGTPKPIEDDGMLVDATDTYLVDSQGNYIVEQ
ncbi:MAG: hypothetical protein HDT28_05020 [Clostridiales bacterium]|nr:hypothetical protein [Clostridiales bacterium]